MSGRVCIPYSAVGEKWRDDLIEDLSLQVHNAGPARIDHRSIGRPVKRPPDEVRGRPGFSQEAQAISISQQRPDLVESDCNRRGRSGSAHAGIDIARAGQPGIRVVRVEVRGRPRAQTQGGSVSGVLRCKEEVGLIHHALTPIGNQTAVGHRDEGV